MSIEQRLLDKLESKQRLVERQIKEMNKLKMQLGNQWHKNRCIDEKNALLLDALQDVMPHVEHNLGLDHPKIINGYFALGIKKPPTS